jgi:hypothetical protein
MNSVPEKLETPSPPTEGPRGARLVPVVAIVTLLGIGAGFWWLNGPRVFAEMLVSAWALCF